MLHVVHGTISLNGFYIKQTDFLISYKDSRTTWDLFIGNIHLLDSDTCVVPSHDDSLFMVQIKMSHVVLES